MAVVAEFKKFIASGNVIGLAVAVVLGTAFGLVVASFTNDILMQLIAALGGKPNFASLAFTLNGSVIRYGAFLNALINFLIIGAVMFFVARLYNRWTAKREQAGESEADLLRQIRDELKQRRVA